MTFRSLEKRRVRAAFGKYLDEKTLEKLLSELSEWDWFILWLPRWAKPIFRRRLTGQEFTASVAEFEKAVLARARRRCAPGQISRSSARPLATSSARSTSADP